MSVWILVADRSGAQLIELAGAHDELVLVEEIEHPAGRLHEHDFESDRGGRTFDSAHRSRHALASSSHEHDAEGFAKLLIGKVEHARQAASFTELVLIAEPHFLGLLRRELGSPLAGMVKAEIHKHLRGTPLRELRPILREALGPARVQSVSRD